MADEYISREAAIAAAFSATSLGNSAFRDVCDTVNRLRLIPAADVAPVRHGRWLETTQPMGWDDVMCAECSECGEDFVLDEWDMDDVKNLMHYCPNCGAKMEVDECTSE